MQPSPDRRYLVWFALIALIALSLAPVLTRQTEPSYKGKTLTEWLYSTNPDIVFMPNDFYGHIHNELWEGVVDGGYAARSTVTNPSPVGHSGRQSIEATEAIERIGRTGVPRLVQLMNSSPGPGERFLNTVGPHIPPWLFNFLRQSSTARDAERCQIAACDGFAILGTNAESALPALKAQLAGPRPDFELGCGIACIGPKGYEALVEALNSTNSDTREVAAFSLGESESAAEIAVPALLNLVGRDQASYQVLGALGRLGGNPDLVVPVLTKYVAHAKSDAWDPVMAILVLGLFGEKARSCAPLLARLYPEANVTTRQVIRMVLHHIDPAESERLLARAWNKTDEEDPWWNGTKE